MKPKKSFVARLAGIVTATLLAGSLLAVPAAAEEPSGDLVLKKTATLEEDGTYTISLDAYATGSTTTTTQEESVPLDIVLVIDQSGSMKGNLSELQSAVSNFVSAIQSNAQEYNVNHRVAIVGFASGENTGSSGRNYITSPGSRTDKWINTGLYVNGVLQNYEKATYTQAQNPNRNGTYYTFRDGEWKKVSYFLGGWYISGSPDRVDSSELYERSDMGLTAQDYQDALISANVNGAVNQNLTKAIANLGANGGTYTYYGLEMARSVFQNNPLNTTENPQRKRVVVLFSDGETDSNINSTLTQANELKSDDQATIYCVGLKQSTNEFLKHVSSNYPTASYANREYSGTQQDNKYFLNADSSQDLEKIFQTIQSEVTHPTTTVTLGEQAVMKDILSDDFMLPSGYDAAENITVLSTKGSKEMGSETIKWEEPEVLWNKDTQEPNQIKVSVDSETGKISVSGFNYAEKYIADSHPGEKLTVVIRGILAKDTACGEVYTNSPESGIYENEESTEVFLPFNQPKVMIPSKSYVLDYGKEVKLSSSDWNQDAVTSLDKDGMNKVSDTPSTSLQDTYGNIKQTENDTVTYTPTKLNWDGVDTFYSLGKTSEQNTWAKINVMPANNVYYEDTFITNEESGTVGIVYTGTWNDESIDGSGTNTENPKSDQGAWSNTNDLGNDTGDSDGTSHKADVADNQATASFTFTGTGVDVYSRTSPTTGTILVQVKNKDGQTVKTSIIDTKSANEEYYQVPTYSFSGEYGTYTVTINVTSAAKDRYTYYLDGIRVYNPIQDKENDPTVADAYSEEQLNAVFTNARDMLEDGHVAFIDEDETGKSTVGDYTNADIGKIAPKNEIYLAQGQSIVLKVDSNAGSTVYLGMKSLTGNDVTVEYSGAAASDTISHTTDLYYKVTPDGNGTIVVKNMSENILSITKVRVSGTSADTENALQTISADEALNAVASFALAPSTDEAVSGVTEEELAEQESPAENETEEPTVTEEPENDPVDVVIENPEEPAEKPAADNSINQWINTIFNSFRNLFGRH